MEHLILRVLSFDLTVPTPLAFLTDYCTSNNLSDKIQYLAQVKNKRTKKLIIVNTNSIYAF